MNTGRVGPGMERDGDPGKEAVLTRHRFTVDDDYATARAGILDEDSRVELRDGEVVERTPIGVRHAASVKRLIRLFSGRLAARAVASAQDPVRLGKYSEPGPVAQLPLRARARDILG